MKRHAPRPSSSQPAPVLLLMCRHARVRGGEGSGVAGKTRNGRTEREEEEYKQGDIRERIEEEECKKRNTATFRTIKTHSIEYRHGPYRLFFPLIH